MARSEYVIAGFDLEANNLATDGTSANNGYGVYLITPTWATQCSWSNSATIPEPYINSNIRNGSSVNTPDDDSYRDLIGDHLVERNVLVSSSVDPTSGKPTSYSWSKESITVPTMHNMTGESYADDGELNFLLPLCKTAEGVGRLAQDLNYYYWSRNIYGIDTDSYFKAWQYGPRYNSGDCSILSYKRVAKPNGIDSDGTQSVAVLQMIMIR